MDLTAKLLAGALLLAVPGLGALVGASQHAPAAFGALAGAELPRISFPNPLDLLANCDTGFRPELDGFNHKNLGSYDDVGNCWGMSIAAGWYFDRHRSPRLAERFRDDETRAQEAARHLHAPQGTNVLGSIATPVGIYGTLAQPEGP